MLIAYIAVSVIFCIEPIITDDYRSQANTVKNETKALLTSLLSEFNANLSDIKVIQIINRTLSFNNNSDPYTLLLIGNELYRVPPKSLEALAILTNNEILNEQRVMKANTTNWSTNAHEKKSNVILRLHYMADAMAELKAHLISQQEELIEPIQSKIINFSKILEVFQLSHTDADNKTSIIAMNTRMKENKKNIVIIVDISTGKDWNKILTSILSQRLKNLILNLKTQIATKRQINKRSTHMSSWTGQSVYVNKFYMKDETQSNIKLKSLAKKSFVPYLNGKVITNTLIVKTLRNETTGLQLKRRKRTEPLSSLQHLKIEAKSINNISWEELLKTLYRKGMGSALNGDITLAGGAEITFITIDDVNGHLLSNLMTISTDQVIESKVELLQIITNDVTTRRFNRIKHFIENIVLVGHDNVIDSRVKMSVCNVKNSLKLSDDEGENMTENIVGAHEDLIQIYSGRISIKGSVSINNVSVSIDTQSDLNGRETSSENFNARQVIVNGIQFALLDLNKKYWIRNIDQDFGDITFNKFITSPQADIIFLNSNPTRQYYFLYDRADKLPLDGPPLFIYFQAEVNIGGNVFINKHSYSQLRRLSADAINRLENAEIILDASAVFKERILVNSLEMQIDLNNLILDGLVPFVEKGGKKQFTDSIFLENNMNSQSLSSNTLKIQRFNDYNALPETLNSVATLDAAEPSILIFEGNFDARLITLKNVNFIENHNRNIETKYYNFNETMLSTLNAREQRIQSLVIDGMVRFDYGSFQTIYLNTLNGLELDRFFELVVSRRPADPRKSIEIGGEKTFISILNAVNVHTNEFNKQIQIRNWIENAFRQQQTEVKMQQIIERSGWQFASIISDNIQIGRLINGIEIMARSNQERSNNIIFIDENPLGVIKISSDISFSSDVKVDTSGELISAQLRPCSINHLVSETLWLMQMMWYEMNIIGNVKLLTIKQNVERSRLLSLLKLTFTSSFDESVDTNLIFKISGSEKFSLNRIISPIKEKELTTLINNINLAHIFDDAVIKTNIHFDTPTPSTIFRVKKELVAVENICTGTKVFLSDAFFVSLMNNVNSKLTNNTLLYRSEKELFISSWQQLLFIHTPATRAINIENNPINGVLITDIIFLYSGNSSRSASISFENFKESSELNILDSDTSLNVDIINGMPLEFIIENRSQLLNPSQLSTHSINKPQIVDGFLTFENFILTGGETRIDQINDAVCEDVVFEISDENQHISGYKKITGIYPILYIEKPFHTWKINYLELVSTYAKTMLLNHKQTIERIRIKKPHQLKTKNETNILNFLGINTRVPQND